MRKTLATAMVLAVFQVCAWPVLAADKTDQPASTPTIKGKLDIDFKTRTQCDDKGRPEAGVKDEYKLTLAVADTVDFQGTITRLPALFSSVLGREQQSGALNYNLDVLIHNPAKLTETKSAGKMVGTVPIDKNGVYKYNDGNLRIAVNAMGKSQASESAFRGTAAGKPPKNESTVARAKKKALTITKQVKGQMRSIAVTDYDLMNFENLVLAAGPAQIYPEVKVNGRAVYDYERSVWFFENLTATYLADGKEKTDRITGSIRWIESPQRQTNGEGQYEFDVRLNEPKQDNSEAAAFQAGSDESAFFATDASLAALTGTAKYKDEMRDSRVISSKVTFDLTANQIGKPETVYLAKLIPLIMIAPLNDE